MSLIQIVPALPPKLDGVGDYSYFLARRMFSQYAIKTHFILCDLDSHTNPYENFDFDVSSLKQREKNALIELIPESAKTILLHYSDYPYDPKLGAPFWLLSALESLKETKRVVVMFHEFPYFYLRKNLPLLPIQKYVADRLATVADLALTNNSATQAYLSRLLKKKVSKISVFSNIGELDRPPAIAERKPWLIVFGTPGRRARIYQKSVQSLADICQKLDIKKILDIGSSLSLDFADIDGIPVAQIGEQPAQHISDLMKLSLAGIAYSSDNRRLSKSGVFAAYCAHGLVPIITRKTSSPADGLIEGSNFLSTKTKVSNLNANSLDSVSRQAAKWYSQHNQAETAAFFYRSTADQ